MAKCSIPTLNLGSKSKPLTEFYGADEVYVDRSLRTSLYEDSEDEYLSLTEDETDARNSIRQVSAPTGAPSGSSLLCVDSK